VHACESFRNKIDTVSLCSGCDVPTNDMLKAALDTIKAELDGDGTAREVAAPMLKCFPGAVGYGYDGFVSVAPSTSPTETPTASPTTGRPTNGPTGSPTSVPTTVPTSGPTGAPTTAPSAVPTRQESEEKWWSTQKIQAKSFGLVFGRGVRPLIFVRKEAIDGGGVCAGPRSFSDADLAGLLGE
jgi:hypothetical protein